MQHWHSTVRYALAGRQRISAASKWPRPNVRACAAAALPASASALIHGRPSRLPQENFMRFTAHRRCQWRIQMAMVRLAVPDGTSGATSRAFRHRAARGWLGEGLGDGSLARGARPGARPGARRCTTFSYGARPSPAPSSAAPPSQPLPSRCHGWLSRNEIGTSEHATRPKSKNRKMKNRSQMSSGCR